MKKYKTEIYANTITEIDVTKETAKSVWVMEEFWRMSGGPLIQERKHPKEGSTNYHDTWDAAHQFLMRRATEKLADARRELQLAQSEFGNVKGMKPPIAA